jgi:hypothetical protein
VPAVQYEITPPADHDPGTVRERGGDGSPVDRYAPFPGHGADAMTGFPRGVRGPGARSAAPALVPHRGEPVRPTPWEEPGEGPPGGVRYAVPHLSEDTGEGR